MTKTRLKQTGVFLRLKERIWAVMGAILKVDFANQKSLATLHKGEIK